MGRAIALGSVLASTVDGVHRVEADVGGEVLWYESADLALSDAAEALASPMLIVAAVAGTHLEIHDAVSPVWLRNVEQMLAVWEEWWGYPANAPRAPLLASPRERRDGAALCFSGGVDSFYTLLCEETTPRLLVYAHGYDIYLHDRARAEYWKPAFREVGDALGITSVWLETNLRALPGFAPINWERSHGGALAALGHLLADAAGTLLISSGPPASYDVRWGTHWRLDPLWSSERLETRHCGSTRSRLDKVRGIATHELARRHLRVCWEHRLPTGNCSRCDKCLCTMVLIDACDAADRFEVFDWSGRLDRHVAEVPTTVYVRTYQELLETGPPRRLARAIRALLRRTAAATPP